MQAYPCLGLNDILLPTLQSLATLLLMFWLLSGRVVCCAGFLSLGLWFSWTTLLQPLHLATTFHSGARNEVAGLPVEYSHRAGSGDRQLPARGGSYAKTDQKLVLATQIAH